MIFPCTSHILINLDLQFDAQVDIIIFSWQRFEVRQCFIGQGWTHKDSRFWDV